VGVCRIILGAILANLIFGGFAGVSHGNRGLRVWDSRRDEYGLGRNPCLLRGEETAGVYSEMENRESLSTCLEGVFRGELINARARGA